MEHRPHKKLPDEIPLHYLLMTLHRFFKISTFSGAYRQTYNATQVMQKI
jgi:hypothetical protein